jgi:hypothetical protein
MSHFILIQSNFYHSQEVEHFSTKIKGKTNFFLQCKGKTQLSFMFYIFLSKKMYFVLFSVKKTNIFCSEIT